MSLRYLLPFLFLLVQTLLPAQRVTVSESMSLRNDVAYHLLGDYKGFFLLFRDYATRFEVQAFDDRLHKRWEKEIVLDERRPQILEVLPRADHFSVLYASRFQNQTFLKAHKYNAAANLTDSTTLKVFDQIFLVLPYNQAISEDKSKIVSYRVKSANEIYALCVDMDSLRVLWEVEFAPDDMIAGRDLKQVLVDNQGNMCLVLDKLNRKEKAEEHHFELFFVGPATGNIVQRVVVPMRNILTFDALFSFDNLNRYFLAAGLYFLETPTRAEGHFFLRFPVNNLQQLTLRSEPFEEEFVSTFMGKDAPKKNKSVIETEVREIVPRQDGGILLIGERIRVFERNLSGGPPSFAMVGGRFITDFYFDDLFAFSIHPNGLTHWKTVLHKKQYSQDDDGIYSSYFLFKTPTSLRLIFNDEIKYENSVSEYVLKGDGSYDRNAVLSTDNQKIRLRFAEAVQVAADAFVVSSERRNRLRLVKVRY